MDDIQLNVKIPKEMHDCIVQLVEKGRYKTKSEVIRDALRKLFEVKE